MKPAHVTELMSIYNVSPKINDHPTDNGGKLLMSVSFNDTSILAGIAGTYNLLDQNVTSDGNFKNVPAILRNNPNWILLDPNIDPSKPKKPHLCRGVNQLDGLKPCNWVGSKGWIPDLCNDVSGIAYVLDGMNNGSDHPVAISISRESGLSFKDVNNLWLALGLPYFEHRSDSNGWVIVGLVSRDIPYYKVPGFEITCTGYIELSGLGGKGSIKSISDALLGFKGFTKTEAPFYIKSPAPETPREIARLESMLGFIPADCPYDTYRSVIWGILSTDWKCAERVAYEWSTTAANRFDKSTFNTLIRSYDNSKTPTVGTICHFAKLGGWNG